MYHMTTKSYVTAYMAISFAMLFAMVGVVLAMRPDMITATPLKSSAVITVPEQAVVLAPGLISLGTALDPETGEKVEGYMIITRQDHAKKPTGTPGGGTDTTAQSTCFGYMATGAKWKGATEPWVVDPANPAGISDVDILAILSGGIAKWEDAANGVVGDNKVVDVLGDGSYGVGVKPAGELDGINSVVFGALSDSGTIAVTTVWGIFGGRPSSRQLVEWDQVYNTNFQWGLGGSDVMDFESIATHELGHSVGMADLYTSDCVEETMYGYGSEGDIHARDLHDGDIVGVDGLY